MIDAEALPAFDAIEPIAFPMPDAAEPTAFPVDSMTDPTADMAVKKPVAFAEMFATRLPMTAIYSVLNRDIPRATSSGDIALALGAFAGDIAANSLPVSTFAPIDDAITDADTAARRSSRDSPNPSSWWNA
jgi:hypothetical protein